MRRIVPAALFLLVLPGCGSEDGGGPDDGGGDRRGDVRDDRGGGDGSCTEGDTRCDGVVYESCADGVWVGEEDCAESGLVCDEDLGCVECLPGRRYCDDQRSMLCDPDGSGGTLAEDCSATYGTWCDDVTGMCVNECAVAAAERSNIGCEYWAVDLDNSESPLDFAAGGQFAVVVANVNTTYTADVWVYRDLNGPGEPVEEEQVDFATVDPGTLYVFRLPRYDVDGVDTTPDYDDGPQTAITTRTYRVVSSVPVVAYQFNTIDQVFSNAASLLLPTTALGMLYHVVTWPPANPIRIPAAALPTPNRCYVTIVANQDGTTVNVTPTWAIEASIEPLPEGFLAVDALEANETYEFVLNRYEVLHLENRENARLTDPSPDLTGTIVESSAPVTVFTGQDLAGVGDEEPGWCTPEMHCTCCMEHMEMQVIPKTAMGKRFVVSHSPWRNTGRYVEPDYFRVLAVRDGTHVTTTLDDHPTIELNANEWFDFKAKTGFVVESTDFPIQVVQYLTTHQRTEDDIGDPEMIPVPAVEQRRGYYLFTTGEGFSENWAVVSMPDGTAATIDGADVADTCDDWTDGTLGGVTYRAYYCAITEDVHVVDAGDAPVGVTVYGYYEAGSYGYPAGSDLREIFLE
jgi:hypothetical protein